jgi:type IV secretion system protein VirB1
MIGQALLAGLLSSCAPNVSPDTMRAIVMVESNADALAIGDNTTRQAYSLGSYRAAIATATALIAQGHNLDLGIAQVNSVHLNPAVTIADLFDPCRNLRVASAILADDYARARKVFPKPQRALCAALGAYNTGSLYNGAAYVARVVAAASVPSIKLLNEQSRSRRVAPQQPPNHVANKKNDSTPASALWRGTWGRV